MKLFMPSRRMFTRRLALAVGGLGMASMLLPESIRSQEGGSRRADLRAILSRMTPADKVGQLLMANLEPIGLEEKIRHYRCGSLLVWGGIEDVDVMGLCELTNRAQALSLQHRKLPLWLHGYSAGLGFHPGWLRHAARSSTALEAEKAAEILGRRWRAAAFANC